MSERDDKGRFLPKDPSEVIVEVAKERKPPIRIDTVEPERYAIIVNKFAARLLIILLEKQSAESVYIEGDQATRREAARLARILKDALSIPVK